MTRYAVATRRNPYSPFPSNHPRMASAPTSIEEAQEQTRGEYRVVITHVEHGTLGELDETFDNGFDAGHAAHEASMPSVGIHAETRPVNDE